MESPPFIYLVSLVTSTALTVAQICQSYALRGFATPRLASVARGRVLAGWLSDFGTTQGIFQQSVWTVDMIILFMCLHQTPAEATATLWLWRGALLFRAAHMIPSVFRGMSAAFIWDVMKNGSRDFRDEAEVVEFLKDYRGVESFRTWYTHVPSLILIGLAVTGALEK